MNTEKLAVVIFKFYYYQLCRLTIRKRRKKKKKGLRLVTFFFFPLFLFLCFRLRVGVFCPNLVVDLILEIFKEMSWIFANYENFSMLQFLNYKICKSGQSESQFDHSSVRERKSNSVLQTSANERHDHGDSDFFMQSSHFGREYLEEKIGRNIK